MTDGTLESSPVTTTLKMSVDDGAAFRTLRITVAIVIVIFSYEPALRHSLLRAPCQCLKRGPDLTTRGGHGGRPLTSRLLLGFCFDWILKLDPSLPAAVHRNYIRITHLLKRIGR